MTALDDFYSFLFPNTYGATQRLWNQFNDLYNKSHGSDRYWLSQIPFFGTKKQLDDTAQQWQDQFDNTGNDPTYSTSYGTRGSDLALGGVTGLGGVRRMARTLSDMHPPDVMEDCELHRFRPARPQIGGRNLIGNNTDIDMEEY